MNIREFLFKNKTARQTVAKNTFWLFFGQIFSKLIKLAIIVYAARVLSVNGYGAFSYALSLAGFFTTFADFGLNATIVRESSKDLSIQEKYFSTALVIKLIMLALISISVIVLSPLLFKDKAVADLMPIVILIVAFDSLRDFGASLARAWEKMEIEAVVQIITNVFIVAGGFLALYYSKTPKALSLGYVLGTGLGMISAFYPFRRYLKNVKKTFSKSIIKTLLYSSWPMGILAVMGTVMLNTDNLMIAWLKSITEVGYYSAPLRITQIIFIVPAMITVALFPQTAKLADQKERLVKIVEKSLALMIILALPLTIGGILLSQKIIVLLFGYRYIPATITFMIMSLMFIPTFMSNALGNQLFALRKERQLLIYAALGIFGNLFFDILLIPPFGIAGSALASLINTIIITLYLYFSLKKHLQFRVISSFTKTIIASAVMVGFIEGLLNLNINVLLIIISSALAYIVSLIILKEETAIDIKNIILQRQ